MFFKFTNRNPFRDLVRNARRVATASIDDAEKVKAYNDLYRLISSRLSETERYLNSQTAFCKRAEHWNQRDVASIRAVTNLRNPWLSFKREFEQALKLEPHAMLESTSRSLAWFYSGAHNDDWIND